MFALSVIGPPGVGKTAVVTALHDGLVDDDIAHAAVEIDALSWAHPSLSDEQSFRHLQTIRDQYVKAGLQVLLCGATVTSPRYLDRLLDVLAADENLVVRLEAETATLQERIVDREPPEWSGLPRLIAAAGEIAAMSQTLECVDLVISTDGQVATTVAERIRATRPDVLLAR